MRDTLTRVLLVTSRRGAAKGVRRALAACETGQFQVEWVRGLAGAIDRLAQGGVDIVLLDLALPDGRGLEAFEQIRAAAGDAMILVLSAASDEATARQAVRQGAMDYLVEGHVDAHWLPRTLHYAVERKAVQDALRASEARFRAISDASPLGIMVCDARGDCVYTNVAYQSITGLTLAETLGSKWSRAIHPADRQSVLRKWQQADQEQTLFSVETRILRRDGDLAWVRLNAAPMGDGTAHRGHVHTVEDVTERKATERILQSAEEILFTEKERAEVTLNSIGDAVLCTDLPGRVTYLNTVAEAMTGWPREEAIGRPLAEVFRIIDGMTRMLIANPAERAIRENLTIGLASDSVLVRRDGVEVAIEDSSAPIHNRDGSVAGAVIVFHDVTESRAMTQKMAHLAQHDFLTGLPNRALLIERLDRAIGLAQRHRKQLALLFIDLDYFKTINDSLGHTVGDQLLQSVAARLLECVRTTDTVCRQGGDEFVILLAEIERPQRAAHVSDKLLAAFAAPHLVDGHELHVNLSIGISIYPDDGIDVDTALRNADTAMYHAKGCGRNNYQFFTADMNARAVQRLSIESNLRRALKDDEFALYYQPKVDLASGTMTGSEALIRWLDPVRGVIYPAEFVTVAEESGLIVPIGRWVLREACRQVKAWLDSGLDAVPVAVNISAVEFRHLDFLAGVTRILAETGLAPRYLEMEVTEGILMHDAAASASLLAALKDMGIRLAIDDFGTGYSSLSYLRSFPIDTLKIDRSFVSDISLQGGDTTIVTAIIAMGRNLNQKVVAEGVETLDQLRFLRARCCDEGQGYQFSRPLSAGDFGRMLGDSPRLPDRNGH